MRIAFYAPLKPPDHAVPSGDRRMARLLWAALRASGHEPVLASRLQSRDGAGDPQRQARLAGIGQRLGARYLRRVETRAEARPDLWLTYHLYYKAPDWIGPAVARALGIPYVVAEASLADKRRGGAWEPGDRAVREALGQAAIVLGLNSGDREGVLRAGIDPARWIALPPFLDRAPSDAAIATRAALRAELAARWRLDPALPWLVAVAMMRRDVKLQSYRLLGAALASLRNSRFELLIAGDGPARDDVAAALGPRAHLLGELGEDAIPQLLAASDIKLWPAIGEAYGMALLEAQAAGLPVIAGNIGGVPDIVEDGMTGLLVPVGDSEAFAAATATLIADPDRRRRMGAAARAKVAAAHDLARAARLLDGVLRALVP